MAFARALAFYLGLAAWTIVLGIAFLPTLLLPRRVRVRASRFWAQGVLAWLGAIVGLHHRVTGEVPCAPVIVACRHQSAWETVAVAVVLDDPAIVMKQELLWLPVVGWYLAAVGMIAIDRGGGAGALRRLVRRARRAVDQRRPIVVFPEGTRVPPGERREYHPGIYALYRELALPVVPAAVDSGHFWPRRSFAKKPGTITLELLPAIAPGLGRDAFMRELRHRIETAGEKLTTEAQRHRGI
jgi:1-acyl-sn-glycerol-3-phosphate acyltransferase